MAPRTVMVDVRSRRRLIASSARTSTLPSISVIVSSKRRGVIHLIPCGWRITGIFTGR